ncbi:Inhibin beta E chain [Toxocara canis]|uniref:Inhibin beta E chain n=1 Tax=Toxocara canis TaxID=6265 RepID=A0A0B2VWC5_TOXCA|nr:Inhibin beta E chain [Toxocara canis]
MVYGCMDNTHTTADSTRRTTHNTAMNIFEQQELARERRRILELLDLKEPPIISSDQEAVAKYVAEIHPVNGVDEENSGEDGAEGQIQLYIVGKENSYCSSTYWRCYRFDLQNSIGKPNTKIIDTILYLGRHWSHAEAKIEAFLFGKWTSVEANQLTLLFNDDELIQPHSYNSLVYALPLIRISCSGDCLQNMSPVIALKLEIDKRTRKRRRAEEECEHGGCCLRSFYFNFSDNSWNKWIIKPEGYNMNYCSGHCQVGHQFDSARDVMTTLARLGADDDRLNENPPCCTPTAYRSLKVRFKNFCIFCYFPQLLHVLWLECFR